MQISSVLNNRSVYSNYYQNKINSLGSTQSSSEVVETSNLITSDDGDTLELSGLTAEEGAQFMTYGPPRMGGSPPPEPSPEIQDFLDKVSNGTVTDEDLTNMQSYLQEMQQSSANENTLSQSGAPSEIQDFLDKVASGTVTDEDLTGMQPFLQEMQQSSAGENPPTPPGPPPEIQDFLDKVANGTVTDEDLDNMKTFFENLQNRGSESGSSDLNSSDLDAAKNEQDPFQSFLDKVAAGTVTAADLTNMQNVLLQMNQQPSNSLAPTTPSAQSQILMR